MNKYDPNRSVGFLIHEVARLMRAEFTRQIDHLDLTQAQWLTLGHLARNEGLKQAQLAGVLEIRPITLTRLIDRLQAAGLVERRPDPDDRRVQRLFLTDAAQPLIAELWAEAARVRERAMEGLSKERRAAFVETLGAMRANLSRVEAQRRLNPADAGAETPAETRDD